MNSLASFGIDPVRVYSLPRVHVVATGNEILPVRGISIGD